MGCVAGKAASAEFKVNITCVMLQRRRADVSFTFLLLPETMFWFCSLLPSTVHISGTLAILQLPYSLLGVQTFGTHGGLRTLQSRRENSRSMTSSKWSLINQWRPDFLNARRKLTDMSTGQRFYLIFDTNLD